MKTTISAAIFALLISLSVSADPIPVKDLYVSPTYSQFEFSPNGKYVSMHLLKDGEIFLVLIDLKTMQMKTIASFEDGHTLDEYVWLNDSTIYFKISANVQDAQMLLHISEQDGQIKATHELIPHDGVLVSKLPQHPNHVLYAEKRDSGELILHELPISALTQDKFGRQYYVNELLDEAIMYGFDDFNQILFSGRYDEEAESLTFFYRNLAGTEWKTLFSFASNDYSFMPTAWLGDDKFAVLTNQSTDKVALFEFDAKSGTLGELLYEHSQYDLLGAQFSRVTGELEAVTYLDHGQIAMEYFSENQRKQAEKIGNAFPDSQFLVVAYNQAVQKAVLKTIASDQPGNYYLFHADSNNAELIDSAYETLKAHTFAKTEVFQVDVDGELIEAYLTMPQGYSHNTLLVMPHGGPIGIRESQMFNNTVQFYTSRGYAVLQVNFRGSAGFGKRFLDAGRGQFGKLIERDITAAVKQVRSRHQFKYMCAIGASYGGYSSMMLAIKHPDAYDCVVASFGVYDLPLLFNESNFATTDEYRDWISRTVGEMRDELYEFSPVYMSAQINVPVMLIAGKDDLVAVFEQTKRMEYMLKHYGKSVETLYYDDAGHGHTSWYWTRHQEIATEAYLSKTLGLSTPDTSQWTDTTRQAIAKEYSLVADSYYFNDQVTNDDSQAYRFYSQAAQLDDARAHYYIGQLYRRGKSVEQSYDTMLKWYQEASGAGNAVASYVLGNDYHDGRVTAQNVDKSFHFYQLAKQQKYDASSLFMLARAYCLGLGTQRDLAQCLTLLDYNAVEQGEYPDNPIKKYSYRALSTAISDIIIDGQFTANELRQLQELIADIYKTTLVDVKIQERNSGLYLDNEDDYDDKQPIYRTFGTRFGARFEISYGSMFSADSLKVMTVFRWSRTLEDGTKQIMGRGVSVHKNDSEVNSMRYAIEDEYDLEPAVWELEVFDLNQNRLYQRTFRVTSEPTLTVN